MGARLARLRVDLEAIVNNWRFFQHKAPNAEIAAVVKADAYGLGSAQIAQALARAGARTFFTATSGEAAHVRVALGEGPNIFVLNGPLPSDAGVFSEARLSPVLNSLAQIQLWANRAAAALHIDTGMNRLGVGPDELGAAHSALSGAPLAFVMSHLACSSTPPHPMNAQQRARFIEAAGLFSGVPRSLSATCGALISPAYHFDLVRVGVGLYGSGGLDAGNPQLNTAAIVDAPILQVRSVEPGETFGYGATSTAAKRTRAATVALGYADGYLRSLGGRGYGVLANRKLPILGRVSMDLIILDVTACPEAAPGAMVEFLGPNAPLDDVAALAGTAPYEILTTFAGGVRKTGAQA